MSEHYEGSVELVDQKIQDNKQGQAITVFLKMAITKSESDRSMHKELIDFMGESVKATLLIETDKKFSTVIEGEFWMKAKKLKKQNLLIMEITIPYDKPLRKKLVDLEFHQLQIVMDKVQRGFDEMEDDED